MPDLQIQKKLADEVRTAMVGVLGTSLDHGQVLIYESEMRSVHETRDNNFVFIELLLFSARSPEIKEALYVKLDAILRSHLGGLVEDIFINILETDRHNWARNGQVLSKVDLGY